MTLIPTAVLSSNNLIFSQKLSCTRGSAEQIASVSSAPRTISDRPGNVQSMAAAITCNN